MSNETWETVASETVLEHPFLAVTMTRVRLPDGRVIPDWPIVYMRDHSTVLVLDEANKVMVLESYKHGVGRSSWKVVGGYLEGSEDPLAAAQRELLEETGHSSDDWQHLGSFVLDANRHGNVGHYYVARNARRTAAPRHDDLEQFVGKWVPVEELRRALFDGRVAVVTDAATIALGLLALGM